MRSESESEDRDLEQSTGLGKAAPTVFNTTVSAKAGSAKSDQSANPSIRSCQIHPQIALVFPVFDTRGAEAERIHSWTRSQNLARDRFRVLIVADSERQSEKFLPFLTAHDEVVIVPSTNDVGMWNAGSKRAGTPWIVMTEGHCIADANCLKHVADWIAGEPDAAAGNFRVDHPSGYRMAALSERWFAQVQARWRSPSEWDRLHRAGCVLRADAFDAVGGFAPYAGQFAYPLLSAKLIEHGYAICDVPGASVVHMDSRTMRDHHIDTMDHVRGECEARARHDAAFFERYFGHDTVCANFPAERHDVAIRMVLAVIAAILARPGRAGRLGRLLPRLLKSALFGNGIRIRAGKLHVLMDEVLVDRFPLPSALRWRRYLRAHENLVELTRREWASSQPRMAVEAADWRRIEPELLPDGTIIGIHGLENWNASSFRWSRPVFMLRFAPLDEDRVLTIDTGGMRGDPADHVMCALIDGRPLPTSAVKSDGGAQLRIPLHKGASTAVLVFDPLRPSGDEGGDGRWLGMPIFGCTIAVS